MAISDELRKLVDPNNECCCEHCLSNKCKEWALRNNFCIISVTLTSEEDDIEENLIKDVNYAWAGLHNEDKIFRADNEPKAIFLACEYILKNNSKRTNMIDLYKGDNR